MRKIVINTGDNGEFMLSNAATVMLYKLKHNDSEVYTYKEYYDYDREQYRCIKSTTEDADIILNRDFKDNFALKNVIKKFPDFYEFYILDYKLIENRHDPDLVHVIETLGESAGGNGTKPCIVEIDDNDQYIIINDNNGKETLLLKSKVNEWDWQ